MYVGTCNHMRVYIWTHIRGRMWARIYVHMCTYIHICGHAHVEVCAHIVMFTHIHSIGTHIWVHMGMHV